MRKVTNRSTPQSDESEREDVSDNSAVALPSDPAEIAAIALFRRALAEAGVTFTDAGRNGSIVLVSVREVAWTKILADTWAKHACPDMRPEDGCRWEYWHDNRFITWLPTDAPSTHESKRASDAVTRAVFEGRHCLGVATSLDWLPGDLVQAADVRLTLPSLSPEDVVHVAEELTNGHATASLTMEDAATVTPRLLRLARRLGQTADEYIGKLADLLARDRASAAQAPSLKTDSPRDTPTLARLHGMDEAVRWGMDVARDLAAFAEGTLSWADVDRGCLLSGPPGCGKTLFARALAATCGVPLVVGSYGEWHGTGGAHQGDLLKAMRNTFAKARDAAPCILFIDEIDSFPNRATIRHRYVEWETQVVNAFLAEIDGVNGRDGVVLLGACNHPYKLDPALVRSGRLDRHIRISMPGRESLVGILREQLGTDLSEEDLSGVALAAVGSSGADCERYAREARRRARIAERPMVMDDLMQAVGGDDGRTTDELYLAAIHEAGHAVALDELEPEALESVSILTAGRTAATNTRGQYTATHIHQRLVYILGGRAAEEIIVGAPSSGAGGGDDSDLALATRLATIAASAYGLDPDIGLLWRGVPEASELSERLSDASALTNSVRAALDNAYREAVTLIRRRRTAVEAVARELMRWRVLDRHAVAEIIAASATAESDGVDS